MLALAILRFAGWEAALFAAAIVAARWMGFGGARRVEEKILAVLAAEITLESTFAAIFSYARINGPWAYWIAAAVCATVAATPRGREALRGAFVGLRSNELGRHRWMTALLAALSTPLVFLSFRPVEEADSINYLHYLIDWMANRATPYTFATNYVAFWELSFLPAWTITRVDFFFPLLALKAVLVLALAVWLLGREFGLQGRLLLAAVFGIVVLRHVWWQTSGVPTLKNDVLHGAGFVMLVLAVARAARRGASTLACRAEPHLGARGRAPRTPAAGTSACATSLFAFGAAFAAVKYTGIFEAAFATAVILFYLRGRVRVWPMVTVALFVLATSGHYYLHNLLLYGNPFYPFQINLAFLHLPGTADLSNTSILYNLGNPGLWRAFFLPAGGISLAGLLFPLVLAATPIAVFGRRIPIGAAALVLVGWLLYFRSVYSAGAGPNDIGLVLSLNTIRYVIGALAVSELCLIAMIARFPRVAIGLVAVEAASRLGILYARLPSAAFPIAMMVAISIAAGVMVFFAGRRVWAVSAATLLIGGPLIDERNHRSWLEWWSDLQAPMAAVRGSSLALVTVDDWGYFAGHIFAAGNPVHAEVRAIEAADFDALRASDRPRYLAALPTPGSPEAATWRERHQAEFARWGYTISANGKFGAIFERLLEPERVPADAHLDAWYLGLGGDPRTGEIAVDIRGRLFRLEPQGRRPLVPAEGVTLRLTNLGGALYRWRDGHWNDAAPPPPPGRGADWNASIGGGSFQELKLTGDAGPFVRLRANNDARWLIYSAAYPDLPDGAPVTIEAVVRCPKGCSLTTAGHTPELETSIRSDDWQPIHLTYAFQKNGRPQHYAVGLNACHEGDWFDVRSFRLRMGSFPLE